MLDADHASPKPVHGSFHLGLIADVARHTIRTHCLRCAFPVPCLHCLRIHVGDHDVSPSRPRRTAMAFPDAVGCADNQGDLAPKTWPTVCLANVHAQTPSSTQTSWNAALLRRRLSLLASPTPEKRAQAVIKASCIAVSRAAGFGVRGFIWRKNLARKPMLPCHC